MPDLIVIRLHPIEPTTAAEFETYLQDLTITAYDLSFGTLEGDEIGTAKYQPPMPEPNRISQHFSFEPATIPGNPPELVFYAVATAVIEVPAGRPEYSFSDIRLDIERGGKEIINRTVHYNAPTLAVGAIPDPIIPDPTMPVADPYAGLEPVGLYAALPPAGRELDPTDAYVELPDDGTPPAFDDLRGAVEQVLAEDPGGAFNLAGLTPEQARHVAFEIVWNRNIYPLPEPSRPLEEMYTGPHADDDEEEQARRRYEAELSSYYAVHNAEVEHLSGYVFSVSAAVWCEEENEGAERAGFSFPVRPGAADEGATIKETRVILAAAGAPLDPSFTVPAEYFYAIAASMRSQVTPQQRYQMATLENEQQILGELERAIDARVITDAPAGVAPVQAARRLHALGTGAGPDPVCTLSPGADVHALVQAWLNDTGEEIADFWDTVVGAPATGPHAAGHLDLVLCALTRSHQPLVDALEASLVNNVDELAALTAQQWRDFFRGSAGWPANNLLPSFTAPGTAEERLEAFIRHVQKFFQITSGVASPPPPTIDGAPGLERSLTDPLRRFAESYQARASAAFIFGSAFDGSHFQDALSDVFPADSDARRWLEQVLRTINVLFELTDIGLPDELHFSLMEALYARGFTSADSVKKLTEPAFQEALTGTVAYDHAAQISANAEDMAPSVAPDGEGFQAINRDGSLTNCIPPPHLSPLGLVAYLREMLRVSTQSTCRDPLPEDPERTLGGLLTERCSLQEDLDVTEENPEAPRPLAGCCGPPGTLKVTRSNLEIPLPLIDLVNECLEALAAEASGAVYDTATDEFAGHKLRADSELNGSSAEFGHDPETLFETLPEHSTPATPVAEPDAYSNLKGDFTAPLLPYSQPLDISRSYLRRLRTSRYDVMRRLRKDITELVIDPAKEPVAFQRHLWRYPVRIEIAREYLGITPEEYDLLFTRKIADSTPADGQLLLWELYGFDSATVDGTPWTEIVVKLSEFLKRTGLTYCEFLELWKSEFVIFHRFGEDQRFFPECEPCCLEKQRILFEDPEDTSEALELLIVFIRLWRKLQAVDGAKYTFTELRDIAEVLQLFDEDGEINPDFVRQLAAFQILRDDFDLALVEEGEEIPPGAIGSDRMHLLALWVGEGTNKWFWAVDELLDRIQDYALARHHCQRRPPEFLKLLEENLDRLSRLAGFNPANAQDTWHAHPAHTLRFVEILAKIYTSQFGVGEILFLFTADEHLNGDDPFPLQTQDEALGSPLGLPDDVDEYSLWTLRRKLRAVEVSDEDAATWNWLRIDATLRTEFGFEPPAGTPDPLLSLGRHFFPRVLEAAGLPVAAQERQYRVDLTGTSPPMWNTPEGPFRYDTDAAQLWTGLPMTDEAVIVKLSHIRQLNPEERNAVQELYFLPRVDLAPFAFIFGNFGEAEERLIQETDEERRWAYFQQEFARCYARCKIIAEHLACHVSNATGQDEGEDGRVAWRLLQHLFADENRAQTNWESNDGQVPDVAWGAPPNGGAFAALLGLAGTGLLGEFVVEDANLTWEDDRLMWEDATLVWREMRGPMVAFGPEENAANAPVPSLLPSMDLSFTIDQERYAVVRNGFALSNPDGAVLGGAQGFGIRWHGSLLVERAGEYEFRAGAPTPDGEEPDFKAAADRRWRVILERGQDTQIVLSHNWPDQQAPAASSELLSLKRGTYHLTVEFLQPDPGFDEPGDVYPQTTGFQLKYAGPDSGDKLVAIPLSELFRNTKDEVLDDEIEADGTDERFLRLRFTSTLRDIRRTYQRAFKALLFAHRFGLSAEPIADDGQSELDYMLGHAGEFVGTSYFRQGGVIGVHRANFDPNFLPLLDNYHPPSAAQDKRVDPSPRRQQALFDWWERTFDYTQARRETQAAAERPLWLLFHEAAETHPDNPAHLVRHMGVDLRHATAVLSYYEGYQVTSADLEDDRWAVRVWQAEKWIRALLWHFAVEDIRNARPDLWATDEPDLILSGETESGNENLTKFVRDGSFENGEPRRYEDVKRLNNELRERGRQALLAYLTGMNRVALPWGGFVEESKHLSELLLIDVEAGICQKASRIEWAINAVQTYIQRIRLGLESSPFQLPAFLLLWDRRFATFHVWEACKRREIYRENWIDWEELEQARRSEAFQFLEEELRRATLTVPVASGLEYWPNQEPPIHPGLQFLQAREPAHMRRLEDPPEGLGLLGTRERHARPSWLTSLGKEPGNGDDGEVPDTPDDDDVILSSTTLESEEDLPLWLQAAIRLGVPFARVAAAGVPPASTAFEPREPDQTTGCCVECGKPHLAVIDEFYFWLLDTRYYKPPVQDADWGTQPEGPGPVELLNPDDLVSDWHKQEELPKLLHWNSQPMVHLAWCRVHNGEFQQPRRSVEGVRIAANAEPDLEYLGREGDSIHFKVTGGAAPIGYTPTQEPGFRYDMAPDTAVALPLVVEAPEPEEDVGGLPAYPYFAYFAPGAPLVPSSLFSPALSVAAFLRTHCRFEAALNWYELEFSPLAEDSAWCPRDRREEEPTPDPIEPGGVDEDENEPIVLFAGARGAGICCQSEAISDEVAKNRSVTLHYLETLLQWGDALMRRNAPEAFQQARVIFDTAAKILGARPQSVVRVDTAEESRIVDDFVPLAAPLNPRLLALYDLVDDRLDLIHTCLNARRLPNGRPNQHMPYSGNDTIRDDWLSLGPDCHGQHTGSQVCLDEEDWCCPGSPYRFLFLVQKAQDIAADVRGLGAALLAAYEKGDAEYLASLRATHERQLLNLALEVRQNQWREADWQVQALHKTKEIAQTRKRYYENLIANGLNSGEQQYQTLTGASLAFQVASQGSEITAQAMGSTQDMWVGSVGPFPTMLQQLPIGSKLAGVFATAARVADSLAGIAGTTASLRLTEAGWDRRQEEWLHQVEVLGIEIEQIERQILAAERRRDIALRELNNHQRQIEHAAEVHDFLRDKFTNHALYLWLQQETVALHTQMYELGLRTARQAQRAFNYERGHTARNFLPAETWENLHEGLLAGERLQLAVRQMEKSYLDTNVRDYELTKHISLRLHFPMAFLQLLATGRCEIEIPEWMFDLDYPGHYLRRIKNVTLTIPTVVGPYTGVHSRLTLLHSTTRTDPRLSDLKTCCDDGELNNGYQTLPDDPRIVKQYAATEAIATSGGQNDAGMFELNFRDERYLPFEFAGAVSYWRIELPQENNQFDVDSVNDVVLHLNYTAREGGEVLRQAANEVAQKSLPGAGLRFFDVKHDLPDSWSRFQTQFANGDGPRQLELRLGRNMFAFAHGQRQLRIQHLELFFEAPGAEPGAHQLVEFLVDPGNGDKREVERITCVASAEWPDLYRGVLEIHLGPLDDGRTPSLGTFCFPTEVCEVSRAFVFCGYFAEATTEREWITHRGVRDRARGT